MGDRHMAKILLENLIGNAWKFTSRKAETRIEIGEIPRDEGAQGWYVKDNGAGFDPGQSGLLFMPFHRLHTDQEFSGSGIGLSIAHRIVVRHGGKLWAEAELGQGACFYFTLGNFTLVNPGKTHP
jgi:signal transduction histidine kinase